MRGVVAAVLLSVRFGRAVALLSLLKLSNVFDDGSGRQFPASLFGGEVDVVDFARFPVELSVEILGLGVKQWSVPCALSSLQVHVKRLLRALVERRLPTFRELLVFVAHCCCCGCCC